MNKYTVRGPGRDCNEITANSLDDAISRVQSANPGKQVAADATEIIYVCDPAEDQDACQARLL